MARISKDGDPPRHLIIEYKGPRTDDDTDKKNGIEDTWIPAVSKSDDPACAGTWKYVIFDPNDDIDSMKKKIRELADGI